MYLSQKISIIRKARRLTQEELGDKVGVSRQTVSDWEKGKFDPTLDSVRAIAQVLNVSYDALLNDEVDLNKEGTLDKVLQNNNISHDKYTETFDVSFYFSGYSVKLKRNTILRVIIASFLLVISIIFFVLAFTIGDILLIVGVTVASICILIIPNLLVKIFGDLKYLRGKDGTHIAGKITESNLKLKIYDVVKDLYMDVYIPINEIENISYTKGTIKNSGILKIKIINKNKIITTEEILYPARVVEIINSLMNDIKEI